MEHNPAQLADPKLTQSLQNQGQKGPMVVWTVELTDSMTYAVVSSEQLYADRCSRLLLNKTV